MIQPETRASRPTYPVRHDSQYAPKTSSPIKAVPNPSPEIEEEWKSYSHTKKHQIGKNTYEKARRTIYDLRRGPRNGMSPGQIKILTKTMQPRLTLKQINDFLDHKFSLEERLVIYENLSNYHNPAYRAAAKPGAKADLSTALYDPRNDGLSMAMLVWYKPPKLIQSEIVELTPRLNKVVDMVLEAMGKEDHRTVAIISRNIQAWDRYYNKVLWNRLPEETKYHYGDFTSYMKGFINWASNKGKPNIFWFNANSDESRMWERIMREQTNAPMETSDYLTKCQNEL